MAKAILEAQRGPAAPVTQVPCPHCECCPVCRGDRMVTREVRTAYLERIDLANELLDDI